MGLTCSHRGARSPQPAPLRVYPESSRAAGSWLAQGSCDRGLLHQQGHRLSLGGLLYIPRGALNQASKANCSRQWGMSNADPQALSPPWTAGKSRLKAPPGLESWSPEGCPLMVASHGREKKWAPSTLFQATNPITRCYS